MDFLISKKAPEFKLGITDGTTGAVLSGQAYADAPRVTGGRVPTGVTAITLPVGSGRAVVGTGGYNAPKTSFPVDEEP